MRKWVARVAWTFQAIIWPVGLYLMITGYNGAYGGRDR